RPDAPCMSISRRSRSNSPNGCLMWSTPSTARRSLARSTGSRNDPPRSLPSSPRAQSAASIRAITQGRAGAAMKHYTYFRSSAAYRTRIALNLKGVSAEQIFIHLTKDGGKQHTPEYRAVNPQRRVPSLQLDSGEILMQSPAIIEYLNEVHPKPPFLPADPV